ncbi:basigin-like [Planococcus citri]|uniref:basigin-like n=1 Tax=Planococcus citri TaxID=170843 RepID=UPI0031F748E7
MKFHQFCIVSLFYICLLFFGFVGQVPGVCGAPNITLKAEFGEGQRCQSSNVTKGNCIFVTLFKKFSMKCLPDGFSLNSSLSLAWHSSRDNYTQYSLVQSGDKGRREVSDGYIKWTSITGDDVAFYMCKLMHKKTVSDKEEVVVIAKEIFEVRALPVAVPVLKDLTVVDGDTINLMCAIAGKASRVVWKFIDDNKNEKTLTNGTDNRVELRPFRGVPDATVSIPNANSTRHRGMYNCTAISEFGNSSVDGSSYVRIKSKYASLVPFLGICAEVIILSIFMYIHEKNKRDKTKLKESDSEHEPETYRKVSPGHSRGSVCRYRRNDLNTN